MPGSMRVSLPALLCPLTHSLHLWLPASRWDTLSSFLLLNDPPYSRPSSPCWAIYDKWQNLRESRGHEGPRCTVAPSQSGPFLLLFADTSRNATVIPTLSAAFIPGPSGTSRVLTCSVLPLDATRLKLTLSSCPPSAVSTPYTSPRLSVPLST